MARAYRLLGLDGMAHAQYGTVVAKVDPVSAICNSYPILGVPRPIMINYPVILEALEGFRVDQLALDTGGAR